MRQIYVCICNLLLQGRQKLCFSVMVEWFYHKNIYINSGCTALGAEKVNHTYICSQILCHWLGDIVDSAIRFSYRPASNSLVRRWDNPTPESTLSPPSGTMNLATGRGIGWSDYKCFTFFLSLQIYQVTVLFFYNPYPLNVSKLRLSHCPWHKLQPEWQAMQWEWQLCFTHIQTNQLHLFLSDTESVSD